MDTKIFEDTQQVIQEIASKITNMKVFKTKKITIKSWVYRHTPVNDVECYYTTTPPGVFQGV